MLPKEVNSSRRPRIAQNSSIVSFQKRKNCSTQTTNSSFMEFCFHSISADGKISKNDQNNYKKAINFVNTWNNAMNEYLKKNKGSKKQDPKFKECFDSDENLYIASVPNYMAIFMAMQELDGRYSDNKKAFRKSSHIQTQYSEEKVVVDVKSQTQYVRFAEKTTEDTSNIENIPKHIQQSQYGTYPHRNLQKSTMVIQKSDQCPPLKHSTRFSDSNISKTSPSSSHRVRSSNAGDAAQSPKIRQNQSLANFSGCSSGMGGRVPTGLLSTNASEINGSGTPLVIRDAFEKVQNPLGVFVSQGNILKNISRDISSESSVILTDKESGEVEIEKDEIDDVERTSSPYEDDEMYHRRSFDPRSPSPGSEEEGKSMKRHPLNLNERDLNSKDKNFINSIGIFNEVGELKQNAKSYLETKEDVRKGTFRAPRLSELHKTVNFNGKSCTSDSLLSDILSTRSSDFEE